MAPPSGWRWRPSLRRASRRNSEGAHGLRAPSPSRPAGRTGSRARIRTSSLSHRPTAGALRKSQPGSCSASWPPSSRSKELRQWCGARAHLAATLCHRERGYAKNRARDGRAAGLVQRAVHRRNGACRELPSSHGRCLTGPMKEARHSLRARTAGARADWQPRSEPMWPSSGRRRRQPRTASC